MHRHLPTYASRITFTRLARRQNLHRHIPTLKVKYLNLCLWWRRFQLEDLGRDLIALSSTLFTTSIISVQKVENKRAMTKQRVTRISRWPATLIFGGHGKCALHITRQLIALGHNVYSLIRDPDQREELEGIGAKPVVLDIEQASVDDMAKVITQTGASTVLRCAQAGSSDPDRVKSVDIEGAIRSMDATAKAGVKRYISISALDVRDRDKVPYPSWYDDRDKAISQQVYKVIKLQLDAKLVADRNLVTENTRRKLEYTIVRPNGLSDGPSADTIEAGKVHLGAVIPRSDVAAVVIACMQDDNTKGLAFDVIGGQTPIAAAVGQVGRERIDTFEGTY